MALKGEYDAYEPYRLQYIQTTVTYCIILLHKRTKRHTKKKLAHISPITSLSQPLEPYACSHIKGVIYMQ